MNAIFKAFTNIKNTITEQFFNFCFPDEPTVLSLLRKKGGELLKHKIIITLLLIVSLAIQSRAEEGMWLTSNIEQKIKLMKKAGLKLSAEDIYSINKTCLKDAIVGLTTEDYPFDSFCTGSFVSDKGLILTNYHPIIRYLESFSSKKNDFLKFGYWSTKPEEETNCRGLQVIQLVKMIDVTTEVKANTDSLSGTDDDAQINKNAAKIVNNYTKGTKTDGRITSFMGGNQYVLSIYKIYKDVRMVAAPPMALGKFAGDADNWTWPRHTADFAFLRVYVDKNNESETYKKENVALHTNQFLKISTGGIKENDFAMTIGFPARSKLYIPSFAVDFMENVELPARIKIRGEKLRLINQTIEANPEVKFRYTARVNSIANNYLRWRGELAGLKSMQLANQKKAEEKELTEWINADESRKTKYGNIIEDQSKVYDELKPFKVVDIFFNEAGISGADVVPFAGKFEKMVQMFGRKKINEKAIQGEIDRLLPVADMFFKDWNFDLDRQMYRNMFYLYYRNVDQKFISQAMVDALKQFDGDVEKYSEYAFKNSILTDSVRLKAFLSKVDTTTLKSLTSDPIYKLAISYYKVYTDRVLKPMGKLQAQQSDLYTLYMQAFNEKNTGKLLPSDANRTQRLSYGKITGCTPANGLHYNYFTTIDGLFEKNQRNMDNPDYYIPKKLRELFENKDFGEKYISNGTIPVNFLTDCHTTSGSSGSPVLNAKGQLIGLNFDRISEGVASDYKYQQDLSRSIAVDVRYILFILEKYSLSKGIVNEFVIK